MSRRPTPSVACTSPTMNERDTSSFVKTVCGWIKVRGLGGSRCGPTKAVRNQEPPAGAITGYIDLLPLAELRFVTTDLFESYGIQFNPCWVPRQRLWKCQAKGS